MSKRGKTSFADYLISCRERLDISVKETASAADISEAYLGRLENGDATSPSLEIAYRLSEVYGVTTDEMAHHLLADRHREYDLEIQEFEETVGAQVQFAGGSPPLLRLKDKQRYLELLKSIASSRHVENEKE